MKRQLIYATIILAGLLFLTIPEFAGDYPLKPADFKRVHLRSGLLAERLKTTLEITIPHVLKMNEETGRIANFEKAAGLKKGKFVGRRYNDSDVFKTLEGVAYYLMLRKDPSIEKYMDNLISVIAKAQEKDGYLYTARTVDPENPPPGAGPYRWSNLFTSHELYNVGHMYEAAVAYYLATGKENFLKIAIKNADLIDRVFRLGKKCAYPGHQEIEIGLVKLYRVTGNKKYLKLARYFLDARGRCPFRRMFASDSDFAVYNQPEYMQAHKPVIKQKEAVGHAVRALYMYSALLDVGTAADIPIYIKTAKTLWKDIVEHKIYITGGVGSRSEGEAFGKPYELPNADAYSETCASIANVFFNHRLFLLTGDGKYVDVLERTLYNALLAGISLSGDHFFYVNPLESKGGLERKPWYSCACCPTNLARFLPTIGKYMYATGNNSIYITLFGQNETELAIADQKIHLLQKTDYPWDGKIKIEIFPEKSSVFTIFVRIPGWAIGKPIPGDLYRFKKQRKVRPELKVNSKPIPLKIEKGFVKITRKWSKGDVINLFLPMEVRRVVAHPLVKDDTGRVAFQRGPVVFCFEEADNGKDILNKIVSAEAKFSAEYKPSFLGGLVVLKGKAADGSILTAIPYFAWDNRTPGKMIVWIKEE